ncbi:hypothetical protein Nepgr_030168 [Nepenthes gracilis]|uniref:Uncharacterized protein n=1 Tax=Nepenthes gracilis TaxID=150966 RepID=A0AAD3TE25_NEPGR|nr:hypothetical protein Nepgr_030168 [Nepenthes gracilis]
MGQSLNKLAPGNEDRKMKEIVEIAERYYDEHFSDVSKDWIFADFYRAVCEIVEEINKNLGNTQFRIPKETTLRQAYEKHHDRKPLTKEEFQRILRDVIMGTGFSGGGGKDILFYIFGVPVTALFIKQRAIPKAVPNEIFIPAVTSATVLVLAKLNKI